MQHSLPVPLHAFSLPGLPHRQVPIDDGKDMVPIVICITLGALLCLVFIILSARALQRGEFSCFKCVKSKKNSFVLRYSIEGIILSRKWAGKEYSRIDYYMYMWQNNWTHINYKHFGEQKSFFHLLIMLYELQCGRASISVSTMGDNQE